MNDMKKFGMIALALITATGAFAQKGFEDGSRYGHGQDSIDALRAISIYREFVKTENYKDAYEQGWKQVFHDAPISTAYLYTDGVKIMQAMYNEAKAAKDTEKMAQYSEELFKVFEQRLQYLDKLNERSQSKVSEGDVWGQYGHSYTIYNPKVSISRAYELLSKAVGMTKGETTYYVLDDLMRVSAQRFQNKKDNEEYRDALLQDYVNCATYIDEYIANCTNDKIKEQAVKVKDRIDQHFTNSGAADCETLQSIYGPKIEEQKENLDFLNKIVTLMTIFDCTDSDAYFKAAEYANAIAPSVKTAKSLGKLYYNQRGDLDKAMEYFNQAIELDQDKDDIADIYYIMASYYYSKDKYDSSRSCVQKCLANNPKRGDAYIILALLYAANYQWTSEPALNRCSYFAVIDKLEQAKKVDPSVADRANNLIRQYKEQTPQIEDLFMLGKKAGDTVEIKGWINETVTIR